MIARSKMKNSLIALSGALILGAFAQVPAAHAHWDGWGGYSRPVVYRPVARRVVYEYRPVMCRVAYEHRPVIYCPRPIVRRVIIVERPAYPRVPYGYGWGRPHRFGYGPAWRYSAW